MAAALPFVSAARGVPGMVLQELRSGSATFQRGPLNQYFRSAVPTGLADSQLVVPAVSALFTRIGLIALAAVGYELRDDFSPFVALSIVESVDAQTPANTPFTATWSRPAACRVLAVAWSGSIGTGSVVRATHAAESAPACAKQDALTSPPGQRSTGAPPVVPDPRVK